MITKQEDEYYLDTDGNIIKNDFANQLLSTLERKDKIVAHIPKELHFRLCEIIEDYHIDIEVKEFIDNNYKMMKGSK